MVTFITLIVLFVLNVYVDNPEVIIMDGITMGTYKELPEAHFQDDEDQQYSQIPQNARLFIATMN